MSRKETKRKDTSKEEREGHEHDSRRRSNLSMALLRCRYA